MKLYYDTRFNIGAPIQKHNSMIRDAITSKLGSNQVLIDSTHLDVTKELVRFVKQNKGKQFLIYSGMDWENTKCRHSVHNFLNDEIDNIVYIGNSNTEHYFSFWLDFVNESKSNYVMNTLPTRIENLFLCLNRKPHEHRVDLVKGMIDKNLHTKGLVSLGLEHGNYRGVRFPMMLDTASTEDLDAYGNYAQIPNDILSLSEHWNNHLVNVVTETTHHTDVFLSEKVFKPILGLRPFIILGDRFIYEKLKQFGFDTYDDIFGTGYTNQWHTQRTDWVIQALEDLNISNYVDFLHALRPRLEYNLNQFDQAVVKNKQVINQDWSRIY